MNRVRSWLVCAVISLSAASAAQASIYADFTGGAGTDSVDQYEGIAGSGWTTAWGISQANGSFTAADVVSTSPLNNGGNYFAGTYTGGTDTGTQRRGFIRRDYQSFGNVNVAAAHQVQFLFRLDNALTTFTDGSADYVAIYDHNVANVDTGATSTWMLRAHGGAIGAASAKQWVFYDGQTGSTSYSNNRWVNSGMTIETGDVYQFTVTTNPTTKQYQVNLKNLTDATEVNSASLNYRNFASNPTTVGSVIHFGGSVNADNETLSFSLDGISIVPEPTMAGMLLPLTALMLRRRRAKA